MATISDLQARIKQAKRELQAALPELAVENALNGKGLAERKIREVGFGAKYSNNRVPAWYFVGQQLNKAGENYLINKTKLDEKNTKIVNGEKVYAEDAGVTWAELRQAQGLQTEHVDLGYTNKMWAGLIPQTPYYEEGKIICRLAGTNVEVINKLSWNFQHYGDFFAKVLGPKEIEVMTLALAERIKAILTNNGFNK